MASGPCGFLQCTLLAGHGGDFHVGAEVDPGDPRRRYLYPKAEAAMRVMAELGPGPYIGKLSAGGDVDEDAVFRKRAGLDDVLSELE